jgi:uncharacterized protein
MALNRRVRNRLSELLLAAFADAGKRQALRWLAVFCALAKKHPAPHRVGLVALLKAGGASAPAPPPRTALTHLIEEAGLLDLQSATGDVPGRGLRARWVTPTPEFQEAFEEICNRVRSYQRVLRAQQLCGAGPSTVDPVASALAEAALCFNAGLFFETHEHLEGVWRIQSAEPLKRALQGLIQISVGFHHARQGRYAGAVNLLGRGLEKLCGHPGKGAGLVSDEFLAQVGRVCETVRAGGPGRMRALPLRQIPHLANRRARSRNTR